MLIGLCSDSHDHVEHIKKAVAYFREREVVKVIHAGDYCSPFTIPLFDGLPLHGIFGNNDGDKYVLMKKFESIGATLHGDFYAFELDAVKFAVYHGTYPEITESLELCGKYDVVVSGHTHEPRLDTISNTISINPGSVNGFDGDAMAALFDTNNRKVQFKELN
ncbi:MAG: metallophosphoesterase [Balneolaceae bacterium]|nr:metallophosphoesterase [Balneolaceae bacterium]